MVHHDDKLAQTDLDRRACFADDTSFVFEDLDPITQGHKATRVPQVIAT